TVASSRKCSGPALKASSISCYCGRKIGVAACGLSGAEVSVNLGESGLRAEKFSLGRVSVADAVNPTIRRRSADCTNLICSSIRVLNVRVHRAWRLHFLARGRLLLLTYAGQKVKHYSCRDTVGGPVT